MMSSLKSTRKPQFKELWADLQPLTKNDIYHLTTAQSMVFRAFPFFERNYQHGLANLLFFEIALTDPQEFESFIRQDESSQAYQLRYLKFLLSLEGYSQIYFNFHYPKCPAVDPQLIQLLYEQGKFEILRLLLAQSEPHRSIRPVLNSKQLLELELEPKKTGTKLN